MIIAIKYSSWSCHPPPPPPPQMLMNLYKKSWAAGLHCQRFEDHHKHNEKVVEVGAIHLIGSDEMIKINGGGNGGGGLS